MTPWEPFVDHRDHAVRRLSLGPIGWLYQVQTGRTYSTAYGTIGRERDQGEPVWGPPVFVPKGLP